MRRQIQWRIRIMWKKSPETNQTMKLFYPFLNTPSWIKYQLNKILIPVRQTRTILIRIRTGIQHFILIQIQKVTKF